MDEIVVSTHRLTKSYKGKDVVSGVDMRIRRGEIYGFLGPNGAGKTTLMRMLTNLVKPTSGRIDLFGEPLRADASEVLKRMGSIIEYPVFYEHLSGQANLELHGQYMGFYDRKAIAEALAMTGLADTGGKPVKAYSLGMKQRLGIARAVSTRPELLILDEPVNGMDPVGIRELRELFRMLSRDYGMTLLISSHILQEMEQIADTVGVLDGGRLVREVALAEIRGQQSDYVEAVTSDGRRAALLLEEKLGPDSFRLMDEKTVRVYAPEVRPEEVARLLVMGGIGLESLNARNRTLEEYFLELVQGQGGRTHG